jgi:GT2 family glycosyltransferase
VPVVLRLVEITIDLPRSREEGDGVLDRERVDGLGHRLGEYAGANATRAVGVPVIPIASVAVSRPSATVAIPTAGRPGYLDHALRSVVPQARELGADVVVVDDGPSAETRRTAARHGARCVTYPRQRGLNAARNAAIEASDRDLVCFLDDDVEVGPGWLAALLDAATDPTIDALGGPIDVWLEGRDDVDRERPAISALRLDPDVDQDTDRLWGANLTVRRSAIERIGGFDPSHVMPSGDEEEWLARLRNDGGRIRYVADAVVLHRRVAVDATTRALSRAQWFRGRAARQADLRAARADDHTPPPGAGAELRNVAANLAGLARHRDASRRWTTAHAAGRAHEALLGYAPAGPATPGVDDFLAGTSGVVAGRREALLAAHDRWLDLRLAIKRTGRAFDRLAAAVPRQRITIVVPARPENATNVAACIETLRSTRHDVDLQVVDPAGRPRFQTVEEAVLTDGRIRDDWLLLVDDDVQLVPRFVDRLLGLTVAAGVDLAQPAHRRHGHAAWPITRREPGLLWRETTFVEIGPVTLLSRRAADALLPFPADVGMGWGLDAHWAAVAAEHGWRMAIVDGLPVTHRAAPPATAYRRDDAVEAAQRLLADRPYLPRWELRTVVRHDDLPTGPR